MSKFEPRIVGFLCNWCSYIAADLAGVSRIQYPPNIRIIRVMCSGRVDPSIILETLASGADGVLVGGCHLGDCHYVGGNYQAERKVKMLKNLIALTGLQNERLRLEWISATEGTRFAEVIRDFTSQLERLGPSPLSEKNMDRSLLERILAAKAAVEHFRLRTLVAKERKLTEIENAYGEKILEDDFNKTMYDAINREYERQRILSLLSEQPMSAKALAVRLQMKPEEVVQHIVVLKKRGVVNLNKIEERTPTYTAPRLW